jgi:hypothetical protein
MSVGVLLQQQTNSRDPFPPNLLGVLPRASWGREDRGGQLPWCARHLNVRLSLFSPDRLIG